MLDSIVMVSLQLISEAWSILSASPWAGELPIEDCSHLTMGPGIYFIALNELSHDSCGPVIEDSARSARLKPFMPALLEFQEYMSTIMCAMAVFSDKGITTKMAGLVTSGYVFPQHCSVLSLAYVSWIDSNPPTQSEAEAIRKHAMAAARASSKCLRYLASAPLAMWTTGCCQVQGNPNLSTPGSFLKVGIGIAVGALVVLAKLPESHGSSRAMAAAALDLVHGLGRIPIETIKKDMRIVRVEDKTAAGAAFAGLLLKCNPQLESVYTTSELPGLRVTLEICKGETNEFKSMIEGFKPSQMIQVMEKLLKAVESAPKAEELDAKNATARAMLLGSLPCSYLACKTVDPQPGKLCSGCRVVRYCGARDQKNDWKVHKIACKAISSGKK